MRLDVKMKSGGPWNLRGTRPDAHTAARDAARRSSMSVGEWLDTVVDPTEPQEDNAPRPDDNEGRRAQRARQQSREEFRDRDARQQMESPGRETDDRADEPRRENLRDEEASRFGQQRDRAPQYRANESDAPRWRTAAPDDARTRRRSRRSALYDREIDELQRQLGPGGGDRDHDRGAAEHDLGDNAARGQNQDRARAAAGPAGGHYRDFEDDFEDDAVADLAAPERQPPGASDKWSSPMPKATSSDNDRRADQNSPAGRGSDRFSRQPASSRRPCDEEARAERQRRERELFERAASAAVERRRQSSIDQDVAEIAARQRALDQDHAIESARAGTRSRGGDAELVTAPAPSKAPPQGPEPRAVREATPAAERTFAPWPEGWRSAAVADAPEAPPPPSAKPEPFRPEPLKSEAFKSEVFRPEPFKTNTFEPAPFKPEPSIDLSGLQDQLREMTARIEALRPSNELEKAIVGLRADLAEISRSFAEALPRRALESLETEVRALGQRVDRSRQAGVDAAALSGIERGLSEVRGALRGLMPAEGLAGFDGALKAIASKVDAIGAKDDPAALQQLEAAMEVLRGMIARVASDEALAKVAEDVRALSIKVDRAATGGSSQPTLAALENRIDILSSALNASTEAGHAVPRELEKLLSGLIEKLEWVQLTHTDRAALSHLEDRITALVRRLDASDARLGLLEGVERGLSDLLIHIEQLRSSNNAGNVVGASRPAFAAEPFEAEATIDQTARTKQSDPAKPAERNKPTERSKERATESSSQVFLHDDLFEDAQVTPGRAADAAPERRGAQQNAAPPPPPLSLPVAVPLPPPFQEKYEEHPETDSASPVAMAADTMTWPIDSTFPRPPAPRTPIDPSLPPDHPLEPGLTGRARGSSSASERAVGSEASGSTPPAVAEANPGKPDFIAAARRAAQAASVAPAQGKNAAKAGAGRPKTLTERLRTLAVAAAVVVIVVGGFHIISRLFEDSSGTSSPARIEPAPRPSGAPAPQADPSRTQSAPFETPAETAPAHKEPPHVEAEPSPPALNAANWPMPSQAPSFAAGPAPKSAEPSPGSVTPSQQPGGHRDIKAESHAPEVAAATAGSPMDITSGLTAAAAPVVSATPAVPTAPAVSAAPAATPPTSHAAPNPATIADRLPTAIGGSTLRIAAVAGDPLAAYEVGVRFSEGRGVPANNEEAAHWFEIAAKKGIVPAQFRLGTLYEKGLGVKKDPIAARDYYRAAAEKGHGKAMHNLAVIYAEGADGKPDYATAAQWFRKAADYGVADSQYNLAILYARGVGVEQNLAESYKWFFLAAKEGDQDAAQKRDEIGSRLDRPTLAAARAAAETWTAVPQPADAITVKGVWDAPASSQPVAKPKPRSAKAVRLEAAKVN
jgi:localization factor PodJL